MKLARRHIVVLGVVLAAFVVASPAWGKCGHRTKKGNNPAVSQYIEHIPTSCGPTPDSHAGGGVVPRKISRQLHQLHRQRHGSGDASALRHIASTASPRAKLRGPDAEGLFRSGRNSLGAAFSVATDGSNGRLIALIGVLGGLAALALGGALYRRRSPPH